MFHQAYASVNFIAWKIVNTFFAQQSKEEDFKLTFGMIITECSLSHIAQTYCSFAGWVNEVVAFFRVELTGSDDFGQLLHVGRFDVDNIKRLIGNLHMPEIDPVSRLFHKKNLSNELSHKLASLYPQAF